MNVVVAFVAGWGTGWLSYRIAIKTGIRLFGTDDKFLEKLLDGLGYKALRKLQTKVNDELDRRTPPESN